MKLRQTIFGVLAGVALLALVVPREAAAQIWSEYDISIVPRPYQPQAGFGIQVPRNQFVDIFSPSVVDPDNGVAGPFNIGFPVEYNGQTYTRVYISVNGWVSFERPITGGAGFFGDDPNSLFNNSRPNLTLAPFFGDHYLRNRLIDGQEYTNSTVRYINKPGTGTNPRDTFVVEWENMNVNYYFDPTDPSNPFAPGRAPQPSSIASFQLWIIQSDSINCATKEPEIEFQYGPVGTTGIVKTSGASVGIEDAPAVPNGATSFLNCVAYEQTGNLDSARYSMRLTSNWPPAGFPGRAFHFAPHCAGRIGGWGDGDADLTQLDATVPSFVRQDQRRFVTFADVIRILRHQASRDVPFDSTYGRNGFHGDVNHDSRFYYSTRNYNNTGDSLDQFNNIVRYRVNFPTKDVNPALPFPQDNSFNGFLFDADQQDAALIMLYLAAKVPVLPWLPDTLPPFTGKAVPAAVPTDVVLKPMAMTSANRMEIPVTFNGNLDGALGVAIQAAPGTRIVEVRTAPKTVDSWVEAARSDDRVALAAAGTFAEGQVVATLVVEPTDGAAVFQSVKVGSQEKGLRRVTTSSATAGSAELNLTQNHPNPFTAGATTTIDYTVPSNGAVNVRVFDLLGREVRSLVDGSIDAGSYSVQWDGRDGAGRTVDAGVYYCRIEAAGQSRTISLQVRD